MLGTRFKRLSEKFIAEVAAIYRSRGINFEPAWFPFFYLLDQHGRISVTNLARELEISQSAASQMVGSLTKKKLLRCEKEPADRRVRVVSLTDQGRELQQAIKPIWEALDRTMQRLLDSNRLLEALNQLEDSVHNQPLSQAVLDDLTAVEGAESCQQN